MPRYPVKNLFEDLKRATLGTGPCITREMTPEEKAKYGEPVPRGHVNSYHHNNWGKRSGENGHTKGRVKNVHND